ncbi:diguanylate cyclase [Maridesulfovibrio sp. FT414]|uniref:sensor domain-containing diguanylate cyclase n=1 Tax=Maridesulfovibrio sp. FT414 TaxID=2979469 RepID=UPI003D809EDC
MTELFKYIVVKKWMFLLAACVILMLFTLLGAVLSVHLYAESAVPDDIFFVTGLSLLALFAVTVFFSWFSYCVRICNRDLQTMHDEWESIYENCQVGIAFLKNGRYFAKGNKRLAEIFGYGSVDGIEGQDLRIVHLSDESYREFGEKCYNHLSHGSRLQIEYQLRKKDGTPIWCQLSGKAVDKSDPADLEKGVVWIIEDISKRRKLEDDLRKLAETDELTGLRNRRSFMTAAGVEFERFSRYSSPLSLIMVDIDYFKQVNDTYGHAVGDTVLKEFAAICREQFRGVDVVGRIGGEEFAILLPSTGIEDALMVAERLRRACRRAMIYAGTERLQISASFGVSCAVTDSDVKSLIRRADEALYRAKRNGRDRVEAFSVSEYDGPPDV